MTLNTLSALSFDYFPVDQRSQDVSFEIAPVVKEQSTNTLVLQRRQSVRQALNQYQLSNSVSNATCDLPGNVCAGDVVRVK